MVSIVNTHQPKPPYGRQDRDQDFSAMTGDFTSSEAPSTFDKAIDGLQATYSTLQRGGRSDGLRSFLFGRL